MYSVNSEIAQKRELQRMQFYFSDTCKWLAKQTPLHWNVYYVLVYFRSKILVLTHPPSYLLLKISFWRNAEGVLLRMSGSIAHFVADP